MEVYRATWKYKALIISEEVVYYQQGMKEMDISYKFDNKVIVDNSEALAKPYGRSVYAQKVTLTRKDGEAVLPGSDAKSVSDSVLCTESYETIPVP